MKLKDLESGSTWVVGVQGFASAIFVQYNTRYGRWQWTENLLNARTFKDREEAEKFIVNNAYARQLLINSMPKSEIGRAQPLQVALRVGV